MFSMSLRYASPSWRLRSPISRPSSASSRFSSAAWRVSSTWFRWCSVFMGCTSSLLIPHSLSRGYASNSYRFGTERHDRSTVEHLPHHCPPVPSQPRHAHHVFGDFLCTRRFFADLLGVL